MSFQEPTDWAAHRTLIDKTLKHQIGFKSQSRRKKVPYTHTGILVTCNCGWISDRCTKDLEDAWDLYLDHDYLYERASS